jgi:hypothetical protein
MFSNIELPMQKIKTWLKSKRNQYRKWKLQSKLSFWLGIFSPFGLILAIYIFLYQNHQGSIQKKIDLKKELEETSKGKLDFNERNPKVINIKMGGIGTIVPMEDLRQGINQIRSIRCDKVSPIILKLRDDKLMLSSKFYNFNNEIVGEIEDNEWRLNKNYFKRNYNKSAIEVIDNYDVVVMQVILEKDSILINGVLTCGKNIMICNGDNTLMFSSESLKLEQSGMTEKDLYIKEGRKIKRLFEYTGDDWLGKRKVSN